MPGLPLRSVYRPLVGIPTISVGRYFLTWGKNALIWVKNSQKRGKNGKFCTKLRKIGHFGTFFVQKGGKSKISGGSPADHIDSNDCTNCTKYTKLLTLVTLKPNSTIWPPAPAWCPTPPPHSPPPACRKSNAPP